MSHMYWMLTKTASGAKAWEDPGRDNICRDMVGETVDTTHAKCGRNHSYDALLEDVLAYSCCR